MWSVGAIFAEMVNDYPLWPGDCEIDELYKIFRSLGTPTEQVWPGISELPDYKPIFPSWPVPNQPLLRECKTLSQEGLDLMQKCFIYEPSRRLSARAALAHPYFNSM